MNFIPDIIGLGGFHSCFVSTNGSMICFGINGYGQVPVLLLFLRFEISCHSVDCNKNSWDTGTHRIEEVAAMRTLEIWYRLILEPIFISHKFRSCLTMVVC